MSFDLWIDALKFKRDIVVIACCIDEQLLISSSSRFEVCIVLENTC